MRGLKSDAEKCLLDRVRGKPNLTIATGKAVRALLPAAGRADCASRAWSARTARAIEADAVMLAAGALHSPRLLQSYLEQSGLADELPAYRNVGRNYKFHVLTALLAFSHRPITDVLSKTLLLTHEAFPHSTVQTLGGNLARRDPADASARLRAAARWSSPFAQRAVGLFLQTEDGSHPDQPRARGGRLAAAPADRPRSGAASRRRMQNIGSSRRTLRSQLVRLGYLPVTKAIPLYRDGACLRHAGRGQRSRRLRRGCGRARARDGEPVRSRRQRAAAVEPRESGADHLCVGAASGEPAGVELVSRDACAVAERSDDAEACCKPRRSTMISGGARAVETKLPDLIRFGREICGDLAQAERREWWLANGLGGYAAGTIAGTLTRRYHGLLVAPVKPPLGRHLVMAKADATLSVGRAHLASVHQPLEWWRGRSRPAISTIETFQLDGRIPVWRYACGELRVESRIWMEHGENTTYVGWRLLPGSPDARRVAAAAASSCWPTRAISTALRGPGTSIR